MYIIVGLGNPGKKYARTRHNAGFDALALLADRWKININRSRCKSIIGEGVFAGEKVILAMPQTYMNLSGEAVFQLLKYYKAPIDRLVVVYDDVDLPPGRLRLRLKGSAGTHNGMRSIVGLLNDDQFARLRIGIGKPPEKWDLADFVLSSYETLEERQVAFDAYLRAGEILESLIRDGYEKAAALSNQTGSLEREK